jgi:uncharacterized membrane protein
MQLSLNPAFMCKQILGPALCRKLCCVFVCVGVIALAGLTLPVIGPVISFFEALPSSVAGLILVGAPVLCLFGYLFCVARAFCARRARRRQQEEAEQERLLSERGLDV